MIKKIQKRFILLSMTCFFIVLFVIITGINMLNYTNIVKEADETLIILTNNKGRFPKEGFMPSPPKKAPFHNFPSGHSPEMPYETRYFSVLFNMEGSVIMAETGNIAAINTEDAIALGREALRSNKEKGFLDTYRYHIYDENENTRIIFVDWGRKLEVFQTFLFSSIIISLSGYIIVSLLIAYFSSRIIRPVSESYEKQKSFITNAGHEIKTPLTIINADIAVLEMEFEENEWLDDIKKQTKRLTELTNQLIHLSHMEEVQSSMTMSDFCISDRLEESAASFQALAHTQNKTFTLQIQPALFFHGNEHSIQELITILLDNAIKYSPENTEISILLKQEGNFLKFCISNVTKDTITQEQLRQLFDRFYRTDSSRNSQTGGFGIGLSMAYAIVTAHKGRIKAESKQEDSLSILVEFPL